MFRSLRAMLRRLVSEGPARQPGQAAHRDSHAGQKAEDEPGFGGPTGAEERGPDERPPRPEGSGPEP